MSLLSPTPASFALSATDRPKSEVRSQTSYPHFDWLRIVLASLVALSHQGMPTIGPIDASLPVIVFLALSGWLIGGILFETPVSGLPRFFFNRATRIWIPYLVAVILLYGVAALREGVSGNWLKYLFYDLTFTHTIFTEFPRALTEMPLKGTGNHFWSISVEELFYLAAPLIILFLPFGKKLWGWAGIVLLLLVLHPNFAAIALGVFAALAARQFPGWYLQPRVQIVLWLGCATAFVLCWRYDGEAQRALFAVLLVQCLALPGQRNGIGMFLGAVSYPFYLNHWIGAFAVNWLAKALPPMPAGMWVFASYLVALVAGIATWAFVDRVVMRARDGWYQPRLGMRLTVTAYGLLVTGLVGGTIIGSLGG